MMKNKNLELHKINKDEYFAQQESNVELAIEMGLSKNEFELICKKINKVPNKTELGIFSAMFSEHCSYKSSKKWLKTLPTKASHVIQGPGENAGVIDIGNNQAAVFKIESHNHPSFIEPYQGAATGVGGILRDVFTMGARPIAILNALRFGSVDHPLTKHLVSGVVKGIGGYGNCIGIPTVGGETSFHNSYNGNILVNAMAIGLANKNKIFYSAATGAGNPVIYVYKRHVIICVEVLVDKIVWSCTTNLGVISQCLYRHVYVLAQVCGVSQYLQFDLGHVSHRIGKIVIELLWLLGLFIALEQTPTSQR